jgi:AcrR family transcriptional regulator
VEGVEYGPVPARAKILDAAALVFAMRGFRGATVETIARDAGLTRAGLLHHFPSKEHLFLAVLQQHEQLELQLVQEQAAEVPLRDALVALCAMNAQRPSKVQLFSTLAAESVDPLHPDHDWFNRRYRDLRRITAELVEADQRAGRISPELDAGVLATHILAAFDGLQIQWLHENQAFDLALAFGRMLDQLLLVSVPRPAGR